MMKNNMAQYISNFFTEYLRKQRGLSEKTIETYAFSLQNFINYLKKKGINEKNITPDILDKKTVLDYLNWLEEKNKNSASTRNLRLAVIHTFCEYIMNENVEMYAQCSEVLKIKYKKNAKQYPEYLNEEEIKKLLSKPDTATKKGLRDLAIIALLYDSGCRISEFIYIRKQDLNIKRKSLVILGKGRKYREIPLSKRVMDILEKYIKKYNIQNNEYLFQNSRKECLTRPGVTFIINKYWQMCYISNDDCSRKKITPHVLRRSKATHLLENNVNIYYIRDFLGHESVQTTEIYLRTNQEILSKAIILNSKKIIKDNIKKETQEDDKCISDILNRFK